MPKMTYPQVQAIVDHFEALVTACEEYREFLDRRRRGYQATEKPPYGSPQFKDFAINRMVTKNIGRVQALLDLLDGEGYDLLRPIVDGLGTLESAHKGEWV